ncbi:MAG: bifunctional oligoribonuclease/PAP phosphatase NrnA [Candidatus Cloacimonetes bacterium]|nr:bifunctional oligoribonuclease/PAP phosphatase NrnA [Candidatus Cloacimonadota bacterium]MBT6993327.1 bifunctional oligoribonuclease/PAP phosphatase NrnA [Candidatus Cloacimonadota bacterium]MBT7469751.1 bifunctional oligoribonuclease/PAP phosphatase NrnA [Candidatus Cloacimonadota bacterium]
MKILKLNSLKTELLNSIKKHSSIAILTHSNPDGDGYCAALALQEIISHYGKKADVLLEKPPAEKYDFLDAQNRTKIFFNHLYYEFIIILDAHSENRIGECVEILPTAQKIISIDHHIEQDPISNALTYIDVNAVSIGAIIFELFKEELPNIPNNHYIANAIYTTILNDTDNFVNSNVDAKTFEICSKLMEYNIQPGEIVQNFLLNKPAQQMKFIGEVLSTIETHENDKILFMKVTLKMLEKNNLKSDSTDKIMRWIKGTKDVGVAICFQEIRENRYRLSLRSSKVDVNKVAVLFGGGGHKKASGCEMKGTLSEIQKLILSELKKQL